jgi:hypothetical protein
MKAIGQGDGEGWDKEEGEKEAHPLVFSDTPSLNYLEISLQSWFVLVSQQTSIRTLKCSGFEVLYQSGPKFQWRQSWGVGVTTPRF